MKKCNEKETRNENEIKNERHKEKKHSSSSVLTICSSSRQRT